MVIHSAREDVPLATAMLLWDDSFGRAFRRSGGEPVTQLPPVIVDHGGPFVSGSENYDNAVGACFDYWAGGSDAERMIWLLRDAWMAVVRDGVDAEMMHEALLAVPEFRALLPQGELPDAYRGE